MEKITGNEPVYPDRYEQYGQGITIYQLALKDFMCALIQGMAAAQKSNLWTPEEIAQKSKTLTNAYIESLNK